MSVYVLSGGENTGRKMGEKYFAIKFNLAKFVLSANHKLLNMKKIFALTPVFCLILQFVNAQKGKDSTDILQKPLIKTTTPCCCTEEKPCFEDGTGKFSKQKTHDFILDFKSKDLGFPSDYTSIKKGDYIRVKVVNYNPYLYKIAIETKDSSAVQPNDGGFLSFFLNPDKLGSIVGGLSGLIDPSPGVINTKAKNTEAYIKTIADNSVRKEIILFGCGLTQPASLSTTKDSTQWVFAVLNCYQQIITDRKDKILGFRKEMEGAMYSLAKLYSIQRKLYPDCESFKRFGEDEFLNTVESEMKKYRDGISDLLKETDVEYKKFQISLSPFMPFIEKSSGLKIPNAIIDSFYKTGIKELNEMAVTVDYKHVADMIASFEKIAQNTSCYTSLPIYLYEDFKKINISLIPTEANSILPLYQTSFPVPEKIKQIWGVSSGIFFTGFNNHTYSNKKVNDTTYSLIKDGQGKAQIGIDALAYFGKRIGNRSDFIAGCFGAGMSIEKNPKPRILLGTSYILGERNRLLISLGIVGGYVSELSSAYNTQANYVKPATNYQKDVLKLNGFLSLNYSFLNK